MDYPYLVEAKRKNDLEAERFAMIWFKEEILVDGDGKTHLLSDFENIKRLDIVQDNLPEEIKLDFFQCGDEEHLKQYHDPKLDINRAEALELRDFYLQKTRHYQRIIEFLDSNEAEDILYEANQVLDEMSVGSMELESLSKVVKAIKHGAELKWK